MPETPSSVQHDKMGVDRVCSKTASGRVLHRVRHHPRKGVGKRQSTGGQ